MKLILVGATGLVGRNLLDLAIGDARVESIVAPGRRPQPERPKLHAPVVDFDNLPPDASWWSADAAICTLGTTMRAAGSQAAFRRVDYDYPMAVAALAHRHGTPAFVLNSSVGANPASWFFYNRIKGEVERDVSTVGFPSLTIVRPGLIGGDRGEFRTAERLTLAVLKALAPVLPKTMRINPADRIARAMLEAAAASRSGVRIIGSAELTA